MHRLNELAQKLTPAEVRELEDFAEFLIARHQAAGAQPTSAPRTISFEGWAGALAHVEPEKSNKQLIREAWDEIAAKHD